MPAKKIVLISDKGGISKTDTTFNLGVSLSLRGKKVLIMGADVKIDLNIRCNVMNRNVDYIDTYNNSSEEEKVFLTPLPIPEYKDLHILPRSVRFLDEEVRKDSFKNIIEHYENDYDFVLIDTTANLGRAAKDCLFASDCSIILTDHDILSFDSVHQLIPDIQFCQDNINPNHKFFIIQTKYKNIKDCNEYRDELVSTFGEDKYLGKISFSEVYYKARKELISIYNRPTAANYSNLVKARIEYDYLSNKLNNLM